MKKARNPPAAPGRAQHSGGPPVEAEMRYKPDQKTRQPEKETESSSGQRYGGYFSTFRFKFDEELDKMAPSSGLSLLSKPLGEFVNPEKLHRVFDHHHESGKPAQGKVLMPELLSDEGKKYIEELPPYSRKGVEVAVRSAMEEAFNVALERTSIEVGAAKLPKTPPALPSRTQRTSRQRAVSENVSVRRAIVQAVRQSNPTVGKKQLNILTYQELQRRQVEIPLDWQSRFGVSTWEEAYTHKECGPLVSKTFSVDRKTPR